MYKLITVVVLLAIALVGANTLRADKVAAPAGFDKHQLSNTNADSTWAIVNKKRPLDPINYVPAKLVKADIPLRANITDQESLVSSATSTSLKSMVAAAQKQGLQLDLQSGYRSYEFQTKLYDQYVTKQGQAVADSLSAKPGYSEHQTGLAVDLGSSTNPDCNLRVCFATTNEGKWLASNAHRYGFIERYPEDKQSVTGYEYEPWHMRYVGVALANEMYKQKSATMEEFFAS